MYLPSVSMRHQSGVPLILETTALNSTLVSDFSPAARSACSALSIFSARDSRSAATWF